jgi:hypothetical protein
MRLDALTDPDRHLVRGARRARSLSRGMEITASLAESLDDLERWLASGAVAAG